MIHVGFTSFTRHFSQNLYEALSSAYTQPCGTMYLLKVNDRWDTVAYRSCTYQVWETAGSPTFVNRHADALCMLRTIGSVI